MNMTVRRAAEYSFPDHSAVLRSVSECWYATVLVLGMSVRRRLYLVTVYSPVIHVIVYGNVGWGVITAIDR